MGWSTIWLTFFYTLAIALLMVSRLPVFSGKRVGKRVPPEMVLPVFVVVVLFFALLISYPWEVLTARHAHLSRLSAARLAVLSRIPSARMRPPPRAAAAPAPEPPLSPWLRRTRTRCRSGSPRAAELTAGHPRAVMPRATSVLAAGHRHDRPVGRHRDPRLRPAQHAEASRSTGVKGGTIEIDLHEPARLRTDDLLVLDDGSLVEVVAAPEPLIEARAADVAALARLAWHLGDRHVPVQVLPNRIRARRDAGDRSFAQVARRQSGDDRSAVRAGRRRLCVIARARSSSWPWHDHHHDH